MSGMPGMKMAASGVAAWGPSDGFVLFAMWVVMMVAMMLPSAAPVILLFSRIGATRASSGRVSTPMSFFAAGYLAVWIAFSAVAALLQFGLHYLTLLSLEMRSANSILSGAILIATGVYQWLPVKQSCLSHCRSPLGFLTTSWKEGKRGAIRMGVTHGAFCVGCCWMLMLLLFVGGVMNLLLVAAISAMVLLEKVFPAGLVIARVSGALLVIAGAAVWLGH